MFFIKTKTRNIKTAPDASLALTFPNPAFDGQDRAFSLPFLAVDAPEGEEIAELNLDGLPVQKGIVTKLKSKRRLSEATFKSLPTQLTEFMSGLKINTILPTIDIFATFVTSSFQGVIVRPDVSRLSFTIVLKGKQFIKTYSSAPTIIQVASEVAALINAAFPNFAQFSSGGDLQFRNINTYENFDIDWNNTQGFSVIAETYPADFQETAYRQKFAVEQTDFHLPMIFNPYLYDLKNAAFKYYINNNQNGTITPNLWHDSMQCAHTFCPQVRFEYLLRKALDLFQTSTNQTITLITDAPNDQTISEISVYNLVTIDNFLHEFKSTASNAIGEYKNAYTRKIDLNRHVPDMSAWDLILAVCEIAALYPVFDNGNLGFKSKRQQFTAAVLDAEKHYDTNIYREYKAKAGFTLAFPVDVEEKAPQPAAFVLGGQLKLETKAGTVGFVTDFVPMLNSQKIGVSTPLSINGKTPLRFFYYKGFQSYGTPAIEYPFGTNLNKLPNGTPDGVTSLVWEGANGLYEKAWKGVIETTQNAATFKLFARLTALDIIRLKNWETPVLRVLTRDGYRKGILKTVQVRARLQPQTRYECELDLFDLE